MTPETTGGDLSGRGFRPPYGARSFISAGVAHDAAESVPPGTPPPKITVEVWDGEDQHDAKVLDVIRINDTWHVVVTVDGT